MPAAKPSVAPPSTTNSNSQSQSLSTGRAFPRPNFLAYPAFAGSGCHQGSARRFLSVRCVSALSFSVLSAFVFTARVSADSALDSEDDINTSMPDGLQTNVQMIKGVGPQRAELLAKRGIHTLEDLLGYLPFRYEDRLHFSQIKDVRPNNIFTLRVRVASGQAVRSMRGRDAIYHLLVQDDTGSLPCKFFHGGYLEGRLKPGQQLILHGKAEVDKLRPARIEMINPQFELLSGANSEDGQDSTEVGRIVPIYEAIGTFGTRAIRRATYAALQQVDAHLPDLLPASIRTRLKFPSRRDAIVYTHFPPAGESIDALNQFRSPAQQRLIFEEFFFYQLSLALNRKLARKADAIAFHLREDRIRGALKKMLPFKPTAAQKRVLAEIAADLEKPVPMNRLLQGDVGSGKTIVALQAAVIAIENGCQAALMAPTEILAVQHFLSARRILERGEIGRAHV